MLFDENGNVTVHIAPLPRNETCLNCHAKPDWKKRGALLAGVTSSIMTARIWRGNLAGGR